MTRCIKIENRYFKVWWKSFKFGSSWEKTRNHFILENKKFRFRSFKIFTPPLAFSMKFILYWPTYIDLLPALRTSNYYFIHINLILVICLHIEHRLFSLIRLGTNRILINFKILKMQCTILKNALNHKLLFLIEEIWTTAMIFFIFLTFFGEMNAFFKNLWNLPSTRGRHPGQSLRDLNPGPGEYGIRDENRNSKL